MKFAHLQAVGAVLLASGMYSPGGTEPPISWSDQRVDGGVATASARARDGWYGWGGGPWNDRQALGSRVDSGNIGQLVKRCEKRYEAGPSAAPLVDGGVAYYTTWTGLLVALDYGACDVVWATNVTAAILAFAPVTELQRRSGINAVSRSSPVTDGRALFVGTLAHALVMAVDKRTGAVLSTLQIDAHPVAIVTQSPTFFDGRLLVGTSSLEVTSATLPGYDCCSHVGSMNAVVLRAGRLELAWTRPTIGPLRNVTGPPLSGASVWGSQPVGDAARGQVIVATGNTHSVPREIEDCQAATRDLYVVRHGLVPDPCLPRDALQEAVVALDLATGRVNWARQLGPLDAWNVACVGAPASGTTANCPAYPGLDADFGMAPSFVPGSDHTPHGLDVVVVGQKNGHLYCLSAATGAVLWAVVTGPAGLEGGLSWGVAVDGAAVYYTLINTARAPHTDADGHSIRNSAFGAVRLGDGATLWKVAVPRGRQSIVAPTVAGDLVLAGSTGTANAATGWIDGPGSFVALDKRTGRVVRETALDDYFKGGIAVVGDRVFLGTGYQGGLQPPFPGAFQVWQVDGPTL